MIASTRDEDVLRHRCKNSTANECDIPAHPSALPCVPLPVINASLTAFRIRAPPSDSPPQMNSSVREIRWKFLPESPGPSFLFMLPSIQLSGPAMEKNKKKKKKKKKEEEEEEEEEAHQPRLYHKTHTHAQKNNKYKI